METSTIESEIKHFHLFCGAGGGALGFQRAQARAGRLVARMRCLGGVDVDEAGIRDFGALSGVPGTVMDLFSEATADDLRRAARGERPNILFFSAPCLPANGLVLTPSGARAISTLRANDLVLTHKGRYRPINKVGTHEYRGVMYGLRLNGTVDVQEFTAEHPIWVRHAPHKGKLSTPEFLKASEVREGDRVGFPVTPARAGCARQIIEELGDPTIVRKGGKSDAPYAKPEHDADLSWRVQDLRQFAEDANLWFLLGAYLGDGYRLKDRYSVVFCLGNTESRKAIRVRESLARSARTSRAPATTASSGGTRLRAPSWGTRSTTTASAASRTPAPARAPCRPCPAPARSPTP